MKFVSLRWKISGILLVTNLLIGIFLIFFVSTQVRQNLGSELIAKGQIIARDLSHFLVEQIYSEDQAGLNELISGSISYESVEYVLIQKADMTILADTYNGQVPQLLIDQKIPNPEEKKEPSLLTLPGENKIFDIWQPVEDGDLGYVRVGIRQDYVHKIIKRTAIRVISTIGVAILLAWLVIVLLISKYIIKPLMYLTNSADKISQGKLDKKVSLKTKDEIELLADALERLRESVKIALNRLKKHQTMRM